MLTLKRLLVNFNPTLPIIVACDTSPYGVWAVLCHKMAEQNYSQLYREALAIIFMVQQPVQRLLGHDQANPTLAHARLQKWMDYKIKYRPGSLLANADALSRLPENTVNDILSFTSIPNLPLTISEFPEAQHQVIELTRHGWVNQMPDPTSKPYFHRRYELTLQQECVIWGNKIIIRLQEQVKHILHDQYPGIVRTKVLPYSKVFWPQIDGNSPSKMQSCDACQCTQNLRKEVPTMT
ncbi:hypothetical protein PR048_031967 [Dryococelus australis]|uniref:Uncharacterized protein n=1 Tax=Dryococelus australis TaxID=614101 RepID=A0ABQ9G7C7_9NEOP|nr:hypothetical protein PR048_031967 [Dryococelus australis]